MFDSTTNLLSVPPQIIKKILSLMESVLDMAEKGGSVPCSILDSLVTSQQTYVGSNGHQIGVIPIVILEATHRRSGAGLTKQSAVSLISHTSI